MTDREKELRKVYPDDVYDTRHLQEKFTVDSFCAPCVVVYRKSDGKKGTLEFDHSPRLYYGFREW